MRLRSLLPALACLSASVSAYAAEDTLPGIFDPSFRTLKVAMADNFFESPLLTLGEQDVLTVTFDRITEDRDFLRYRIIHCNADWQPSRLVESEYLDSFNDTPIEDYAFSENTFIHYVNYRIEIPNEKVMPLKSGNYLLQVYDEADPERTLLQARFSVEEPRVEIYGEADAHTDRGVNDEWQQLTLDIETANAAIRDPYNDVILTVEQNYNPGGEVLILHPQRLSGTTLKYEHLQQLIFRAGNEYRRFETVRADYPGMNVDSVRYMGSNYHAWLRLDRPARDHNYVYDQTQNGRYMVREYNATDSDLGADYVTVHFTLETPEIIGADVYVDGEAWLGRLEEGNRMRYDRELGAYVAEIPLKQGSYNYRYLVKSSQGTDPYYIDGDKYETRNEYTVKAYVREPGSRADRLLGVSRIRAFDR